MTMTSGVVHALGMGEIEVNTSLNEPLDAKIKLFSATSEELDTLKIEMASQDIFSRMGIDRVPVLRNLQFELVGEGRGAPYIKVSSSRAIKEPFLDFILAVNWASGQMMREFTLLLDPPVFERDQQVGRVSAATTQPAQVVREEVPVTIPQPHLSPSGSYGPTARTDTLWTVARKMRPDRSVSVPQMMIALLKENPEAFDDNNINNLKAGYILRQPEMDVITALSRQEAAAESNRQYQEWQVSKGQAPAPSGRQQRVARSTPAPGAETAPPATAPAAVAAPKTESQGRLQLLSPDEEARIRTGVGSGTSGEASESLRQQLAIAQETAEATRQENVDLRARLDELERQLQSMQKLLTLKDDTLGALQADAQQEQQLQAQAAAPVAEEQVEPPAAAQQPAPAAAPPEASLLDEVLANPGYLYTAGGGLVILLLVVALIMRRRRQDDDDDFTVMTPVTAAPEPKAAAGKGAAAADVAPAGGVVAAAAAASANEAPNEDVAIGDIGGGLGTIHAEESEIDPIAEADVYLAYRRYEQAEALLKEAISADAERHELKLKLLEIYHATRDVDSFEAQAESLYAALGGQHQEIWAQAVEMGRELLPAHPLFSEGGASDVASKVDLDMEFPEGGEAFNFDDEPQPLSEGGDELSDDDLAGSLGFAGLGGSSEESGGAKVVDELVDAAESETTIQAGEEKRDVSLDDLDDLGDLDLELDLDLDLDSSDGLDLGTESVGDNISDAEPGTDDLDFGSERLEEGSFEELQDLAATDVDKDDDIFDLDVELAASADENAPDLDAELGDFSRDEVDEDGGVVEPGGALDTAGRIEEGSDDSEAAGKRGLSPADDEVYLDDGDPYAGGDVNSFLSDESTSGRTEAAQSVAVTSETDDLLDTAGRKGGPDNGIDMENFSAAPEEGVGEADETETVVLENDQATLTEEELIDPLADIADLGEMDFGGLADEDNDDIFDSSDDMIGTKLDLAKAYIDMGDQDGARSILDEVVEEGDDDQRQEAEQLMQQIS